MYVQGRIPKCHMNEYCAVYPQNSFQTSHGFKHLPCNFNSFSAIIYGQQSHKPIDTGGINRL